jgi:magnesium transporter
VERRLQRDRVERKLTPAKYFEEDFAAFSSYLLRPDGNGDVAHHWTTYVNVADGLEIPQSLLLGPWIEETTRYLYWLVKGGARLDWLTSTSGEVG